jgi:hypothetical protein
VGRNVIAHDGHGGEFPLTAIARIALVTVRHFRSRVSQGGHLPGAHPGKPERGMDRMKRTLDGAQGRDMIAPRFATAEPVFGNIWHHKGRNRSTL